VGNGSGALTVGANGSVTLSGSLGDGTKETQAAGATVSITKEGLWPLYLPLYSGGGSVLGWVTVSNAPGTVTNLAGTLVWIKRANATNMFDSAGFTNVVDVVGSGYVAPLKGVTVLPLPVTTFTVAGADLPFAITNPIALTPQNTLVVIGANPLNLTVKITTTTGLFTGSFINPVTGATNLVKGVLLQDQNLGPGQFTSTTNSGAVLIQ